MKKIKKIFCLAAVAAMACLTLVGCGSEATTSGAAEGDMNKNVETLVMATNAEFPPYEYFEDGKIVGIDADIAAAIAEKLDANLTIEHIDFDSIVTGVKGGKYDFGMAGMTVNPDRLEQVDFTESYATGIQVVIVKEDSNIKSADDLFADGANTRIGVQLGTTGDIYTTEDIEKAKLGTVERYNKGADAIMALNSGKVDCVVIDREPAKAFVKANEGLKILETEYAVEDYAIAVSKNNPELYEDINNAVKELKEDGTIQDILDDYIKE